MEFMGRLAALVPRPKVNLTRFHGVFSPNSKLREYVVPQRSVEVQENPKPKAYSRRGRLRMGSAADACVCQRSERGRIEKCEKCGGPVRIIASIEDPDVIEKILKHLGLDQPGYPQGSEYFSESRKRVVIRPNPSQRESGAINTHSYGRRFVRACARDAGIENSNCRF
jgi:hypothetical protein